MNMTRNNMESSVTQNIALSTMNNEMQVIKNHSVEINLYSQSFLPEGEIIFESSTNTLIFRTNSGDELRR